MNMAANECCWVASALFHELMCKQDKTASTPDLELVGHTDDAEFALGMCSSEPLVASGGKDTNVSDLRVLLLPA